jgi:hypothetical protein
MADAGTGAADSANGTVIPEGSCSTPIAPITNSGPDERPQVKRQ